MSLPITQTASAGAPSFAPVELPASLKQRSTLGKVGNVAGNVISGGCGVISYGVGLAGNLLYYTLYPVGWTLSKAVKLAYVPSAYRNLGLGRSVVATVASNKTLGEKVWAYRGLDLNPAHFEPIAPNNAQALTSSAAPNAASAAASTNTTNVNPATPLPPPTINPATAPKNDELSRENVEKYKKESKEYARKEFYPTLRIFSHAFSVASVLGDEYKDKVDICLKLAAKKFVEKNSDGVSYPNFSLSGFKKLLMENGVKISYGQAFKMFWINIIFRIFGNSLDLIDRSCDAIIDIAYDRLFGRNGEIQKETLNLIMDQLFQFLKKYVQILKQYKESETAKREVSEDDFISAMLRSEHFLVTENGKKISESAMLSHFGIETFREHLKTLVIKNSWGGKASYYLWYKFWIWVGERIMGKMIRESVGPIIDSSITTFTHPQTQFSLNRNIAELLRELAANFRNNTDQPNDKKLNFKAGNDPLLHANLGRFAKKVSELLSLKFPNLKINGNEMVEQLIQSLPPLVFEKIAGPVLDKPINGIIPKSFLTGFEKFLHPDEIHSNLSLAFRNMARSLSTHEVHTDAELARQNKDLKDAIDEVSTEAIKQTLKEFTLEQLNELARNSGYRPHEMYQDELPSSIDIEKVVLNSLVPRVSAIIEIALRFISDKNFLRGITYQAMVKTI